MSRTTSRNGNKSRWQKKDAAYRADQKARRKANKERQGNHEAMLADKNQKRAEAEAEVNDKLKES